MKTYYLVELVWNANKVIAEVQAENKKEAIEILSSCAPVQLDCWGYNKYGETSYCVAERFDALEQIPRQ